MNFDADVATLRDLVERWWAARSLHEQQDGVDLAAVFDSLSRQSSNVDTVWNWATRLRDHLWALKDGHLRLGPTHDNAATIYVSGVDCALVNEGVCLSDVDRGDLILEADGLPIDDYLSAVRLRPGSTPQQRRWHAVQSLVWQERYPGETPSPQVLTVVDENGRRRTLSLAWQPYDIHQPTPYNVVAHRLEKDVGVLAIRSFVCRDALGEISDTDMLRQLTAAHERLADVRHLIIDLRRNGGGRDEQARMVARVLTESPIEWMRHWHPDISEGAEPSPQRTYLDPLGPPRLARTSPLPRTHSFLIGPGCASTAEILCAACSALPDTHFVGASTAGSSGDPIEFRLPRSLLSVTIPIARYFSPRTGAMLEGQGIAPDLPVSPSARDVRAGVDAVMLAALEAIRKGHAAEPGASPGV